jgi:hypothetical protein
LQPIIKFVPPGSFGSFDDDIISDVSSFQANFRVTTFCLHAELAFHREPNPPLCALHNR